jgi:hypothetical protein
MLPQFAARTFQTSSRMTRARSRARSRLAGSTIYDSIIRPKSSSSSSSSSKSLLSRYGLGGHHWKSFNPESYQELIREALSHRVSYLEVAGQEGGDIAMVGAIQSAMERSPELSKVPLTITTRIGYRMLEDGDAAQKVVPGPADVVMAEAGSDNAAASSNNIVHNVSSEFIHESLQTSPLLELQRDMKRLQLVYLIQNPEVQVLELLKNNPEAKHDERQAFIQERWTPALETLQDYSKSYAQSSESGGSISFGVVSNGLGIPADDNHPLHLSADTVIHAAQQYDRFSTVQLPANLLETYGWDMARKIHAAVPQVSIAAMRPLTCYPDLGTGTGHPFRLVDYALPSFDGQHPFAPGGTFDAGPMAPIAQSMQYTHQMTGVPAIYQIALQTAISHFDADAILEIKQERDLTVEERETLDGCKLVQSMIHDLDADLEHVRSFAAHEEELYGRIIPLLYDTFEAMDDHTSDVLQAYFAAYAVAVRYAIAKKTRKVLKEGETSGSSSSSSPTYSDIPSSMPLQEYAVRHMMADACFDRIVIGASTMQDFRHQTELMEMISSDESPLDAIAKTNEDLERAARDEASKPDEDEKK